MSRCKTYLTRLNRLSTPNPDLPVPGLVRNACLGWFGGLPGYAAACSLPAGGQRGDGGGERMNHYP
jgi:hypothetical protein